VGAGRRATRRWVRGGCWDVQEWSWRRAIFVGGESSRDGSRPKADRDALATTQPHFCPDPGRRPTSQRKQIKSKKTRHDEATHPYAPSRRKPCTCTPRTRQTSGVLCCIAVVSRPSQPARRDNKAAQRQPARPALSLWGKPAATGPQRNVMLRPAMSSAVAETHAGRLRG
jgi:hypothetical protein